MRLGPNSRTLRSIFTIAALLALSLILVGCADMAPLPTPTPPPDVGDLQVNLRTNPKPPVAGDVTISIEVKDPQGQPVEGALVKLSAGMTQMSHSGMSGQLADKGGGNYEGAGSFSMSGNWRINVTVDKDGVSHTEKSIDIVVN